MGIREQFRDKAERLAAQGKQHMHEAREKAAGRPAERGGEEAQGRPEQREEHSQRAAERERP
ncbi:hypothetical protein HUT18_12595 [Streptomyces sp. NA04227]|uniref:hypothetical protein n=1 Tax=Streptomyces sp. NA04227 TaxID=2742136 RepID=UPI0015911872|nr:hypothetical protein [Streptomyces sp. NA04227]QKW07113.1 hypothetical protein HUT18_12595 [Streptomyces sp. NA04227]